MHIDPGGILLRQEILIFSMFNHFLICYTNKGRSTSVGLPRVVVVFVSSNQVFNGDGAGGRGRVGQCFCFTLVFYVHEVFELLQLFALSSFLFGQLFVFVP